MDAIKAMVRNGRIETESPINLPDGTELVVLPANQSLLEEVEAHWDDSPEGIRDWIEWYDSLQPLVFTPEEREAWEKAKAERKAWELAHADERIERLKRLWK